MLSPYSGGLLFISPEGFLCARNKLCLRFSFKLINIFYYCFLCMYHVFISFHALLFFSGAFCEGRPLPVGLDHCLGSDQISTPIQCSVYFSFFHRGFLLHLGEHPHRGHPPPPSSRISKSGESNTGPRSGPWGKQNLTSFSWTNTSYLVWYYNPPISPGKSRVPRVFSSSFFSQDDQTPFPSSPHLMVFMGTQALFLFSKKLARWGKGFPFSINPTHVAWDFVY